MWKSDCEESWCWRIDAFELWCWRRLLRVPWTARRSNQSILKEISPEYSLEGLMLKLQCLATWCEELTHWKRPWCWERLKVGGEGDDRGWDGWMASPTWWTWVWISFESWWWTGKPGMLQSMGPKESDMTEQLNNIQPTRVVYHSLSYITRCCLNWNFNLFLGKRSCLLKSCLGLIFKFMQYSFICLKKLQIAWKSTN